MTKPTNASTHTGSSLSGRTFYLDRPLVAGRVWDLFVPTSPVRAAVFFIHGGGWRSGTRSIFHTIIDPLVEQCIACGTADYRLNDVVVADQLTDVREAYAHFMNYLKREAPGVRPIVFGSSAGAHLALLLALAEPGACGETLPDDPALRRLAGVRPAGAAVVSAPLTCVPWDEIVPAIWNDIRRIVGVSYEDDPQRYHIASPIEHVNAAAPPVLLMRAENEDVFPTWQDDAFMHAMRDHQRDVKQIVYPNAEHGFFYDVTRRCQQHAFQDLLRFIKHCQPATTDLIHERHTAAM